VPEERIVKKMAACSRAQMFLGRSEKAASSTTRKSRTRSHRASPNAEWMSASALSSTTSESDGQPRPRAPARPCSASRQQAFGYTQEDVKFLMLPMAVSGDDGDRLHGQ